MNRQVKSNIKFRGTKQRETVFTTVVHIISTSNGPQMTQKKERKKEIRHNFHQQRSVSSIHTRSAYIHFFEKAGSSKNRFVRAKFFQRQKAPDLIVLQFAPRESKAIYATFRGVRQLLARNTVGQSIFSIK